MPQDVIVMDFVFHNGIGDGATYDNRGELDYHLHVEGGVCPHPSSTCEFVEILRCAHPYEPKSSILVVDARERRAVSQFKENISKVVFGRKQYHIQIV